FNGPSGEKGDDVQAVGGGPVAFGTDVRSFLLRAALAHGGVDGVYTVTYAVKDASGNTTSVAAQVEVGHSTQYGPPTRVNKKHKDRDDDERRDRDGRRDHDGE